MFAMKIKPNIGLLFIFTGGCALYDGIHMFFFTASFFELYGLPYIEGGNIIAQINGILFMGMSLMLFMLSTVDKHNPMLWKLMPIFGITDTLLGIFVLYHQQIGTFANNVYIVATLYLIVGLSYLFFWSRRKFS